MKLQIMSDLHVEMQVLVPILPPTPLNHREDRVQNGKQITPASCGCGARRYNRRHRVLRERDRHQVRFRHGRRFVRCGWATA